MTASMLFSSSFFFFCPSQIKICLENFRKLFEMSSIPHSCVTARWLSISRKGWESETWQSFDSHIHWPGRPPKPNPSPHRRTEKNMCLQNRALEEHNGRQKLLWALKRGVTDPHLVIFIKASGRAKGAIGLRWSRARLTSILPHMQGTHTQRLTHVFTHPHTRAFVYQETMIRHAHTVKVYFHTIKVIFTGPRIV